MAAVEPYQRVLLENRDILLNDLNTDDVIPLLFIGKVLSNKEIDDIEIGRTRREKTESLLDVLHYKGERGFDEFCKALEETFPHLASRMSRRDSPIDRTEQYHNEKNLSSRYSSSYSEQERSHREVNGEDFRRFSERSSEKISSERNDMRGDPEPHYAQVNKRPKDPSHMDTSRRGEDNRSVSSYHSQRHDRDTRSLDGDRRRTPRRNMDEINPAENYIYEKQTVILEKANPDQGFGIAVSGGRDNPHNKTGDTSIVVSDIVKGSPADGVLRVNDIIVQVNDENVEDVCHRDAVQALKNSGLRANLIIKRCKVMPALPKKNNKSLPLTVHLNREKNKGFGFSLAMRLYIKDIDPRGLAFHEGELDPGDVILKINDRKAEELRLREAIELVRKSDNLELVVSKNKMDNLNLSTRSLPSAIQKRGFNSRPVENGVDDARNHKRNDGIVERRRAKSMDRAYIRTQRHSRGSRTSDDQPLHKSEEIINKTEEKITNKEPEGTQSEKPVVEQAVVKQEVKPEESVPDLPPRRYSDTEAPKRPQPPDEEDRGPQFPSWKRLENERPREEEHRGREEERQQYVPQPADVTRTEATMDLSMKTWDSLSPGRTQGRESPGSTPRSQRKEERRTNYLDDRDTKSISFRKEGSLGIQIQGGNKTGIFVAAVRESNPAHRQGLRRGDQVLMANDIDFKDITREEAVLLLLSLGDDVRLLAQPKLSTFERIKNSPGDSFYIKAHFDYGKMKEDELDLNREDVFHVWDTMYGGMIGSWHAQRVTVSNEETETGVIPNKCRAEQLATVRQVEEDKTPSKKASRTNSLKRKDSRGGTLKKNYMFVSTDKLDTESFMHTAREFKLPAYERVSLRHPGFVRPVVLLGPIADITRDKLLQDMPQLFAIPTAYGGITPAGHDSPTKSSRRTLSYSTIKTVIDSSKHCLLDIAPDEVERLNYCQLYPIVIYLKPTNKNVVKEMRAQHGSGKESAKHIKKLYDNSVKLEQFYFNMFTATIPAGQNDDWYGRIKEEIKKQQDRRVWMSEDKFEHEDVEFRVHNRYSTGYEYDSHADSPTARSSVSHPPDEEIVPSAEPGVESAPSRYYNGPEVEYRDDRGRYDDERDRDRRRYEDEHDRDRGRYDDERDRDRRRYEDERDRDRGRYDDDRDRDRDRGRYDDRRDRYDDDRDHRPYDDDQRYDSDIERASKPGYKPHGNIVKVLPSTQEPVELRASLRKTRPQSEDFTDRLADRQDGEELRPRDSLRRTEPESRLADEVNPTELELKQKAESLRKVQQDSDLLKKYDERVGVKVSDLWAIDNEVKRERIQPQEVIKVESKPDDLDQKLEELERAIPPSQPKQEPKKVIPAPYRFEPRTRNIVVDSRAHDRPESVVRTTRYPTRSYATVTHIQSKSEPEVRAQVVSSVESAPVLENGYRSLPRDYGRGSAEPERKEIYRAEVTIPRKENKNERPKSAYGYSTQAYAPRPYGSDRSCEPPPRPAQPINYDFKLSRSLREPELRPGTHRPKSADFETPRDESQVITSDFESLDDDTQVVATARGTFTSKGGVLSSPESGVSIYIPEGAIPSGKEQEIYFKVCKDNNIMPPLDTDKGETLLSPLVMCGPHGTQFDKPVELRLPHCASMTPDGWSFALKSSETPTGMPTQWRNVSIPGQENKGDPNSVSVLVDHF